MRDSRQLGFSLMEMLVVLVLVSMISGLVVQTSTTLFGQYTKVKTHLEGLQSNLLPDSWLRASVASLVVSPDETHWFRGDAGYFEGFTLSPVTLEAGALTRVKWSLERNNQYIELKVVQNDDASILVNRWRANSAKFQYYADAESVLAEWPGRLNDPAFLPAGILLEVEMTDGSVRQVLSAVSMRRLPPPDPRDLL